MRLDAEHKLLRIFVGEQDKWKGRPLYEAIIDEAKALKLAGATVLKGFMGYGCKAHVHTSKLLELSYDMPIIVEIVDEQEKIKTLLPKLDEMVEEGMVTIEDARVIIYRADPKSPRSIDKR